VLYNHESPLRSHEFATRKITQGVAMIKLGLTERLNIGNLSAQRDWGYAPEYVEAMRLIMHHEVPESFVVSSGIATTVRDFVSFAFNSVDVELEFKGEGLLEVGFEKKTGKVLVTIDSEFYREPEAVVLVGNSNKAEKLLNWKARTPVSKIAKIMVESDLQNLGKIHS
jgi:GDPmannose 4,6-dehydratase